MLKDLRIRLQILALQLEHFEGVAPEVIPMPLKVSLENLFRDIDNYTKPRKFKNDINTM